MSEIIYLEETIEIIVMGIDQNLRADQHGKEKDSLGFLLFVNDFLSVLPPQKKISDFRPTT